MPASIRFPRPMILGALALAFAAAVSAGAPAAGAQEAGAQEAAASAAQPTANSALARQWDRKLRGMRVTSLSRVNGGSSGGATWRTDAYLCRDGRLFIDHESSVSIYVDGASGGSSGRESVSGRWRVVSQGDVAAVEIHADHVHGYMNLAMDENGRTYANDNRVYVTDDAAERCR